jgi:hypothetical protein
MLAMNARCRTCTGKALAGIEEQLVNFDERQTFADYQRWTDMESYMGLIELHEYVRRLLPYRRRCGLLAKAQLIDALRGLRPLVMSDGCSHDSGEMRFGPRRNQFFRLAQCLGANGRPFVGSAHARLCMVRYLRRILSTVLRTGGPCAHFQAAERLSLRPPWQERGTFERRMGVKLFARTSRRVSLSEGRHLLNSAERALRTITHGIEQVRGRASEPTGVVRLSTVTSYGKHCVLPLLPEFFARYPGITLIISFHDGGRDLSRQSFDVRINWGDEQEPGKFRTSCVTWR